MQTFVDFNTIIIVRDITRLLVSQSYEAAILNITKDHQNISTLRFLAALQEQSVHNLLRNLLFLARFMQNLEDSHIRHQLSWQFRQLDLFIDEIAHNLHIE